MIVTLLNGGRSHGATGKLLEVARAHLQGKGDVQVETIDLGATSFSLCNGCSSCYRTGRCAIDDGIEGLVEKIRRSDGIIIGSPTYGSNLPGRLENLLDRGHSSSSRHCTASTASPSPPTRSPTAAR